MILITGDELIERLALVTGLLEALAELPADSAPAIALGPPTVERARVGLEMGGDWSGKRKKLA